jgi:hypothetical protein
MRYPPVVFSQDDTKAVQDKELSGTDVPFARRFAQTGSEPPPADPDLRHVIEVWADLSPHIRAAVLALVRSSLP